MRVVLFLVVLTITIDGFSEDQLPNRYQLLKSNYQTAIERVSKPITAKYIQELKNLRSEMTASGNLNIALDVEEELKRLGVIAVTLEEVLMTKAWVLNNSHKKYPVTFLTGGKGIISGFGTSDCKWEIKKENILKITCPNPENYFEFEFSSLDSQRIQGKNSKGKTRFLEVVKPAQ